MCVHVFVCVNERASVCACLHVYVHMYTKRQPILRSSCTLTESTTASCALRIDWTTACWQWGTGSTRARTIGSSRTGLGLIVHTLCEGSSPTVVTITSSFFFKDPAGSPSRGGDVAAYVFNISQPSLPTPFYSVLVTVSVFTALSTVFHSINSPDDSSPSHSVLPVSFLPYWSFQLYISL